MGALARPFANVLAVLTGSLLVVALLVWTRSGFATPPYVFMRGPWGMLAFSLVVLTQAVSGYLIAIRRPDLPVGRLALLFSLIMCVATLSNAYLALAVAGFDVPIAPGWAAWLPSWFSFAGGGLTAVVLGLVFPDGRLPGPRWGAVLAAVAGGAGLTAVAMAFRPGPLILYPTLDNPGALLGPIDRWLDLAMVGGIGLLMVGGAAVTVALLTRYREADTILRAQLRWYLASAATLSASAVAFVVAVLVLPPASPWGELVMVAFTVACGLPPIALVFAISRYRLFDIDTILSRAFVYGSLTAILAGVYTASIRLFNSLFTAFTGQASDVALVITTLVIAASFTPVKRRLERFVDSRFRADISTDLGVATPEAPSGSVVPASVGPEQPLDEALVRRLAAAILAEPGFRRAIDASRAATDGDGRTGLEPERVGRRITEHG